MTPQECAVLLTYAHDADPRVILNDATLDIWWTGIGQLDAPAVRDAIRGYYGESHTEGQSPVIGPQQIRKRVATTRATATARQAAREALPPGRRAESFGSLQARGRRSEAFRRAFDQARLDRADRLASRGVDPTPHHLSPAELKEWERLTGRRSTR